MAGTMFFLPDLAIVNAFILWKLSRGSDQPHDQLTFRLRLARQLIGDFTSRKHGPTCSSFFGPQTKSPRRCTYRWGWGSHAEHGLYFSWRAVKKSCIQSKVETTLKQSVATRWNSMLTMLKSIACNINALKTLADEFSERKLQHLLLDINNQLLTKITCPRTVWHCNTDVVNWS